MSNSLDLDPEWGAIDLLEEVEAAFGVAIADAEAERIETLGNLDDLLAAKLDADIASGDGCGSIRLFHALRRTLPDDERAGFRPDSRLDQGPRSVAGWWRMFQQCVYRLPQRSLAVAGTIGVSLILIGVIGGPVLLFTGHWRAALLLAVSGVAIGSLLVRIDPGRPPRSIVTVRDLVERMVPLNFGALRAAGARVPDRWAVLTALAAEHGELAPGEMRRETVLHRVQLRDRRGAEAA